MVPAARYRFGCVQPLDVDLESFAGEAASHAGKCASNTAFASSAVAFVARRGEPYKQGTQLARDKVNLDISWLRDESLEDLDNLPAPEVIAREIVEDLTAALAEFEAVALALYQSVDD